MIIILAGVIGAAAGIGFLMILGTVSPTVTVRNIESHVLDWVRDLHAAEIRPLPATADMFFGYVIVPQKGQPPLVVKRTKKQPKFLSLEVIYPISKDSKSALAKLSDKARENVVARLDKRITKTTKLAWMPDKTLSYIYLFDSIAIEGLTEEHFIQTTTALAAESVTVSYEADSVFASILPSPDVEILQESVDENNVEAFINQWTNASSLSANKLPNDPTVLFGYSITFPDHGTMGVFQVKEKPEYVLFKIVIPLDSFQKMFDELSPDDRTKLISQLESEWESNKIPAAVERPFQNAVLMRAVSIASLTEKEFLRTAKLAHLEGIIMHARLLQLTQEPTAPSPRSFAEQFRILDTEGVKQVESNLILVPKLHVFLSAERQDSSSQEVLADLKRMLLATNHSVRVGRMRDSTDSCPDRMIGLYLPTNAPAELTEGLQRACTLLHKGIKYYPPVSETDLQIVIGPP